MTPFERIVHNSDPVVTTAIEAKHTKDLPKLVEVLRAVANLTHLSKLIVI